MSMEGICLRIIGQVAIRRIGNPSDRAILRIAQSCGLKTCPYRKGIAQHIVNDIKR